MNVCIDGFTNRQIDNVHSLNPVVNKLSFSLQPPTLSHLKFKKISEHYLMEKYCC